MERFAALWTDEEIALLKQATEAGIPLSDICTMLGRTPNAVETKYCKIRKKTLSRPLVRTAEKAGPPRPEGFKVTPSG